VLRSGLLMPRFWLWLVLVYGLLVLILAWQFKVSHDRTVGRAAEHADNLAQIIDSQFTGSLRRVEVSLRQIAARLPRSALDRDVAAGHRAEVDAVLQPYRESFPELLNFFVWDRAGRILYTTASMQNNAYTRGSTARHMGYRELRDNPKATIAFSNLIRGYTTGRMTLAMYVPIRYEQGPNRGQLFAVVSSSPWSAPRSTSRCFRKLSRA
jgi:hypothetical protein